MAEVNTQQPSSDEFALDRAVEDLIGKIVQGTITPDESATYNQLLARRSRMMKPNFRVVRRGFGIRRTA